MLSLGITSVGMSTSFLEHADKPINSKHPKNKNECLFLNKDSFSMSFSIFVYTKVMIMSISEHIISIKKELDPKGVELIAVSKTKSNEDIMEAYKAGQRIFGENHVQELVEKYESLPKDIEWHLVGHLQSNKVKYIAPFISLIHSVDSLKLLQEVNKQAIKNNRVIDCLLQVYIADEDTKFGLAYDELIDLLRSDEFTELKNIRIVGLMGIATLTDSERMINEEFKELSVLFEGIKQSFFRKEESFKEISMGMSSDYKIAIENGSTMVRLGSTIFGKRIIKHYKNKEDNESTQS
jgi:pyridoxal phosphate enzyme (YggS family)